LAPQVGAVPAICLWLLTLATHKELSRKLSDLEQKLGDHDEQIQAIFEAIRQLMLPPDEKGKKKIGFIVKEKQKKYGKRRKSNKRKSALTLKN